MPERLIRDLVIRMLSDVNYGSRELYRSKSFNYLLKNNVVAMKEDVSIIDNGIFDIYLPDHQYHEILYTETHYGLERISRQHSAINALVKDTAAPKAWLLVSTYYHSFFCAVLIGRILGRSPCFFTADDIAGIASSADNPSKKNLTHGSYVGYFRSCVDNTVTIRFKMEGDKPHYTAWKNLADKIPGPVGGDSLDAARLRRVQLFRKIISDSSRGWSVPSEVRNLWNYSNIALYLKKGDDLAKEFAAILNTSRDIEWASRPNLMPSESNAATSIAFISSTLQRALDVFKPKILG